MNENQVRYRGPTEADFALILERITHIIEELAAVHVLCDQILARRAAEGDANAKNR
jgi:hypothetical protein